MDFDETAFDAPVNPAHLLLAQMRERLENPPEKKSPIGDGRKGATRFTTDYAVRYGRDRKWRLIERESYDYRLKRHHDLEGGVDALFDDGSEDRIGIQGAGRSEKARHWQRFMDWGGPEKAKRRHLRVLYLEFERGNHTPIMEEWWS